MKIPIARTSLTQNEVNSVLEPLHSGWLVQGPKVREFEEKWSAFTGSDHSIAVTSCTSAMHLSLAALGFGPGDEAIVPAFTWISTANVVEHLGGKVVFCDIDLETFNMDVDQIETKITSRTKVIMPVHLFGLAADMDSVLAVARKYDLSVVEDAACGFGAKFKERHVGTFGDAGCFSFHPRKAITTGEGGMVTTNDDSFAEKIRRLR
ncbi:MAG: DegT/DnrJ/EryC1/StrS family aminotransferase, partial [Opitutae bacterium]|nr:DegT/DnrJ/EryC1/StrS family aminotransferase [Opitutae bacterium]